MHWHNRENRQQMAYFNSLYSSPECCSAVCNSVVYIALVTTYLFHSRHAVMMCVSFWKHMRHNPQVPQ